MLHGGKLHSTTWIQNGRLLCPHFVNDFGWFDQEEEANGIIGSLIAISEKLHLDFEDDLEELLDSHAEELTNQEFMELEQMQRTEEHKEEEPVLVKKFDTKLLAEVFCLEYFLSIFEKQDPNAERFSEVSAAMNGAIYCFRLIYDEKKKNCRLH